MKIYFTDDSGARQLQECNVSEIRLAGKVANDGNAERSVYRIYNKDFDESLAIMFVGQTDIGESPRNAFWEGVSSTLKHNLLIFDVDEWHGGIKFITKKSKVK